MEPETQEKQSEGVLPEGINWFGDIIRKHHATDQFIPDGINVTKQAKG